MAKAASPVRLDKDLMSSAALAGKVFHRSAAEQVEHWATLGRIVADQVDNNTLISLMAGVARLRVEMIKAPRIDPKTVQDRIDQVRESADFPQRLTAAATKYQASRTHPGLLERIDEEGYLTLGQFKDGVFVPADCPQEIN